MVSRQCCCADIEEPEEPETYRHGNLVVDLAGVLELRGRLLHQLADVLPRLTSAALKDAVLLSIGTARSHLLAQLGGVLGRAQGVHEPLEGRHGGADFEDPRCQRAAGAGRRRRRRSASGVGPGIEAQERLPCAIDVLEAHGLRPRGVRPGRLRQEPTRRRGEGAGGDSGGRAAQRHRAVRRKRLSADARGGDEDGGLDSALHGVRRWRPAPPARASRRAAAAAAAAAAARLELVQVLRLSGAALDGAGELQQAVRQRRLAVVHVRHDREVAHARRRVARHAAAAVGPRVRRSDGALRQELVRRCAPSPDAVDRWNGLGFVSRQLSLAALLLTALCRCHCRTSLWRALAPAPAPRQQERGGGLVVRAGSMACTRRSRSRKSVARASGFRVKLRSTDGRNVLRRRRAKGRKCLCPASNPRSGKHA
eukprot:SM000076S21837  [mRNA]  locus=s76:458076:459690:- [translate_table: standard]